MATAQEQLASLLDDVQQGRTAIGSMSTFLDGLPAVIKAAVDAAMANGATPAMIQPVVDAGELLKAEAATILSKITQNTPQAGQAAPSP